MLTLKKALALLCLGFLFCSITSCKKKMDNTWPFVYYEQPEDGRLTTGRNYAIWAVGNGGPDRLIDEYFNLFEEYGFSGNGYSLAEHIEAIIEKKDAELLNHLDFDPNGNEFLVWADSEDAVRRFMVAVLPVFGNAVTMQAYLKQADPENFME